ncbi:GntR family transcriptional regulator of arabinose operon [Anaerotaenia torta]|uniref:GntR family transcriptional regulator n=1 Tax=Anaerotaenia torta TaxID=433293 RepID=UPI003D259D24
MGSSDLLYKKITDYIKARIDSGELKVGDRLPTEKELAEQFKVSRITSKRALEDLKNEGLISRIRGSGSYVADQEKQAKTEMVSEENLYSRVVSLVIPFDDSNGGIMNTVSGITSVLKNKGYIVDIHCTSEKTLNDKQQLLELYQRKVGGIIYYPKSDRDNLELMNMFYLENYPIVVIDKYFESVPLRSVVSDNQQGMYEAARYLLELGHHRIGFLSDNRIEEATSVRNRYFGYAKALKEYKITVDERYVKNGDLYNLDINDGEEIVRELVEQGVTAMCAINDYVALFLISCLNRLGISVPEQVSVVGFDDISLKMMPDISLTTVRQDLYEIGRCAGEMMLEALEGRKSGLERIVIPTELMIRGSCMEPK